MDRYKFKYDRNEIEELCRLYQEGRLSLKEEKDMEILLSHIDISGSEIIDETLFLMGISSIVSASAGMSASARRESTGSPVARRSVLGRVVKVGAAAALLAVVVTLGWHSINPDRSDDNGTYEVYAFGEKVTDKKKSREMALESYNKSMELIARMQQIEKEKMSEMDRIQKKFGIME